MKQELNISNQQLAEWIDEWQESLFRYAFFRVGDMADAEDIVHDAFLKIGITKLPPDTLITGSLPPVMMSALSMSATL